MNILHLKMFINIVDQKNISKVAELMHISQSALSQQIRTMENEFGATLLNRSPNGVVPTIIGEVVYNKSKEILTIYEDIFNDIKIIQNQKRSVKIVASPVAYSYALPCTFFQLKNEYPDYSLEVEAISSDKIEEKILAGQADMGIIVGEPKDKTLKYKKVFSDPMYLVTQETSSIPEKIQCGELYKYPFLMLDETQKTRRIINNYLDTIGIDISKVNIPYTLDSTESIKLSAVNGYGLAFLPYMAIKKELYLKQLRIVECDCLHMKTPSIL